MGVVDDLDLEPLQDILSYLHKQKTNLNEQDLVSLYNVILLQLMALPTSFHICRFPQN